MTAVAEITARHAQAVARIRRIRRDYRFEYVESLTINSRFHFKNLAVSEDTILASGRKRSGDRSAITVFSRDVASHGDFSPVVSDAPLGIFAAPLSLACDGTSIVHPELIGDELRLVSHDISSDGKKVFDPVPGMTLKQIASVEAFQNSLIVTDEFSHALVEYDESGAFTRTLSAPSDYEYPVRAIRYPDGNYLVAYGQSLHQRLNPSYSNHEKLPRSFLVLLDDEGRILSDFTDSCRHFFDKSPVRGLGSDKDGNIYVLVSGSVIKIDPSGRKVFEAEVRHASRNGAPGDHLWGTWTVADMKYSAGRLYVLGNSSESVIHVFEV